MSKTKKPSKAQFEVLKKMNEGYFIVYDTYLYPRVILKQCESLIIQCNHGFRYFTILSLHKNDFIEIDHSKDEHFSTYYFITEKGKAAANGENKQA